MEIRTIGIDLGKTVFHLVGVNARGEVVVRKKCSRLQLLRFTSNVPACLIGMEACGGSHFLGRALREQGHDVRLMPAQYVKPYVKTNKNDFIDAEACAEAVTRGEANAAQHACRCRRAYADGLQTPHVPPSFAQCLQYLQFLQALHGLAPVQVANDDPPIMNDTRANASSIDQTLCVFLGIFNPLNDKPLN
jgi:hypothetical protein